MTALLMVMGALVGVVLIVAAVIVMMFFNLWLQAKATGVPVSFATMTMMRLRGVDPRYIMEAVIPMAKAGLEVTVQDAEVHLLSGGNLMAVADALIRADKADLGMDFHTLAAIDLAGRDVLDAVQTHVNPKVVACPAPHGGVDVISGVSRDGIQLTASARVTVRTRLDRLVGGAGEDTIVARVGEGIVTAIGRAPSHKEILRKPELISQFLLERGLDSGTAFEIVSVDISDINVEDNIGARLTTEQAMADKQVAQARAEVRRTAAVASQFEMHARTRESETQVVAAKSIVPTAAAAAVRHNNFGRRQAMPATINNRIRWKLATE